MQPSALVTQLVAPISDLSRARLRSTIRQEIARGNLVHIIDLSDIDQLDSPTLAEIIRSHRSLREVGGSLALVARQPAILRLLSVAGLDRVFSIFPSRAEALAALAPGDLIPA
jgi:anti-sigma B factor antagonist